MEKRYTMLRAIGTFNKVFGIIVGMLTIIAAFSFCVISLLGGVAIQDALRGLGSDPGGIVAVFSGFFGIIASFLVFFTGSMIAISLYALGEIIYLIISLEENARTAVLLFQQQLRVPGS